DDAKAFNPVDRESPDTDASVEDRPIGGLGILLVTQLMDTVEYHREGERNHVSLSLGLTQNDND
ncbi:MAG: ATP-binding protein, partial [Pseudomonadota bacterium]